jgi:hypothetical protein
MVEIASITLIFIMAIFGIEDAFLDNLVSILTIVTVGGALVFGFGRWIKNQITNSFKNMISVVEEKVDTKVGELSTKVDKNASELKSTVDTKMTEVGMKMVNLENVNTERFNMIKEGQVFVKENILETKELAKTAVNKVEDVGERLTEHIVESGLSEERAAKFRGEVSEEETRAKKFREGVSQNGTPLTDQYKTIVGGSILKKIKKKKEKPDKPKGKKTKYNNPV